jgi:hypothetical protein
MHKTPVTLLNIVLLQFYFVKAIQNLQFNNIFLKNMPNKFITENYIKPTKIYLISRTQNLIGLVTPAAI